MPRLRETPEQKASRELRTALTAGMIRADLNRKKLAEELGVSYSTVKRWCEEPQKCTIESARALCKKGVLYKNDLARYFE